MPALFTTQSILPKASIAVFTIRQLDQCAGHAFGAIGHNLEDDDPVRANHFLQKITNRLPALVFVNTLACAIGDDKNTDPRECFRSDKTFQPVAVETHEQPPLPPQVHPP